MERVATYQGLPLFNAPVNAEAIVEVGQAFVRKPNPVWMVRVNEQFAVETNEGIVQGKKGDWIAHDPISGHVWPVSDGYKEQHYTPVPRS